MAKVTNLTEKLAFDENPKIQIKDKVLEVNADAKTVLSIMSDLQEKSEIAGALNAYEKLFSEKDRKEIDKMKLSFSDLSIIISSAISLVTGANEEEAGE